MIYLTMKSDEILISDNILRDSWLGKFISMYGSFILFTKQELKTCILLKTSLKIISLSEVKVFCVLLRTSSKVTSLLKMIVFLIGVACSARISYVKGASTEGTCISIICSLAYKPRKFFI